MGAVEFRVGDAGPHHRRRRRVPRLHHPGVRHRLPGQPVRAHQRRRHPVQLRAVLRVRHLLPGVQHRGRHRVDLSRRRPRRRLPPELTRGRVPSHRRRPEVGRPAPRGRPADAARVHDDGHSFGCSEADRAALEWALRLADGLGRPRCVVVDGRAAPRPRPCCATRWPSAPPGPCGSELAGDGAGRATRSRPRWPTCSTGADLVCCGDYSARPRIGLGAGLPGRPASARRRRWASCTLERPGPTRARCAAARRLDERPPRGARRRGAGGALGRGVARPSCAGAGLAAVLAARDAADRGARRHCAGSRAAGAGRRRAPYRPRAQALRRRRPPTSTSATASSPSPVRWSSAPRRARCTPTPAEAADLVLEQLRAWGYLE